MAGRHSHTPRDKLSSVMIEIRAADPADAALILSFIRKLAEYERLQHEVAATQTDIVRDLFGPAPRVFCNIALLDNIPAGIALWFYNYSTFRGRYGIYLEDLFGGAAASRSGVGWAGGVGSGAGGDCVCSTGSIGPAARFAAAAPFRREIRRPGQSAAAAGGEGRPARRRSPR
jgi:hypothetical protein